MVERFNDGDGPRSHKNELTVLRLEKGDWYTVRFLGEYIGTLTHYAGKGVACWAESCPYCRKHLPQWWRGYAPAHVGMKVNGESFWRPFVIEMTDRLRIYLGEEALRGTVWRIGKRPGRKAKDECYGEFLRSEDPREIPPPFEVRDVVERMYHEKNMQWGCAPPFSAPMIVEDIPIGKAPEQSKGAIHEYPQAPVPFDPNAPKAFAAKMIADGKMLPPSPDQAKGGAS